MTTGLKILSRPILSYIRSAIYLNLLDFCVQRCVPYVDHPCKGTGRREKGARSEVALPHANVATVTLYICASPVYLARHDQAQITIREASENI